MEMDPVNSGDIYDEAKLLPSNNINKRIAIIGAGWYGCHLAIQIAKRGAKITVFEKKPSIMQGASGNNSYRLHIGPHYPRDEITRKQVSESFNRFINAYPQFVIGQEKALYGIGDIDCDGNQSKVTAEKFVKICKESDPSSTIENPREHGVTNVKVLCNITEKTVSVDKPADYFKKQLEENNVNLLLDCRATNVCNHSDGSQVMVNSMPFDCCINCTYYSDFQSARFNEEFNVFYEVCVTFIYKPLREKHQLNVFSLSIFDGNFPSLDPYVIHNVNEVQYILTHAKHTPLKAFSSFKSAEIYSSKIDLKLIEERRKCMESDFVRFYPSFFNDFCYKGQYFISIKTKIDSKNDFRGTLVWLDETRKMINVFSGKISTIFQAEDSILKILDEMINIQ